MNLLDSADLEHPVRIPYAPVVACRSDLDLLFRREQLIFASLEKATMLSDEFNSVGTREVHIG
jgi:hypothetical protein